MESAMFFFPGSFVLGCAWGVLGCAISKSNPGIHDARVRQTANNKSNKTTIMITNVVSTNNSSNNSNNNNNS